MEISDRRGSALLWFNLDLRVTGNLALENALHRGGDVLPVFISAPDEEAPWAPGAASRWWLHQSLQELAAALEARGSKLIVRRGPTAETLLSLAWESGATSVVWNRRYEPAVMMRDRQVELVLRKRGIEVEISRGNVLFEPGTILNTSGKPFQVFTAFWRACQAMPDPAPAPAGAPSQIPAPAQWPSSLAISDLGLEPTVDWASRMREVWRPGEKGAAELMKTFLDDAIQAYPMERDRPDHRGTSRISPHLHFGEISARQIWQRVRRATPSAAGEAYLRQIAWREFSYHLLFHFPQTPREPLHPEFQRFPWRVDARALRAWTRGRTGYPLVDAGMRELWHTGWMHNRVRMLAASFLVKHLLIPWQEGAAWFWDTLVDADLANNTMGWQWSAGCGADAAPYFRIFNPEIQRRKFDPDGEYVCRWVPELASGSYPLPIVEHEAARARALASLASMRNALRR